MKKVLVTLANKDYINHAKSIFVNVREEGEWNGDLVLMVPEDDKEFVDVDLFNYNDVQVLFLPNLEKGKYPLDLNTTLDVKFHSINCYKIHLFGNDYFKQWDWIFYTDLDVWYFNKIDFDLDNKRKDFLYANTCKGSSLQYQFVWREEMIEQLNVSDKKKLEELKDYPGWNEPAIMGCFLLLNKQFIRNDIFKKYKEVHDKYYKLAVWSQGLWSLLFYGKWDILGDNFKTIYDIGYNKTGEEYNRNADIIKDNIDYKNDGVIAQHFSQYFPQYSSSNLRFYPLYLNNRVKFEIEYLKNKLLKLLKSNNIDIEVLKENNVFLVGGSILRLFMGLPLDTDLDFYVETEENYKNVIRYLDDNFDFQYDVGTFRSYIANTNEAQLINEFQPIDEFIGNSDFRITKGYFSFRNEKFVFHKRFFDDIKNKKLVYDTDNSPGPLSSMKRADKFKKLGFEVDDESFKKLYEDVGDTEGEIELDLSKGMYKKKSWLRDEDVYPIAPNIDVFVNWLMDIKDHPNLKKFNAYLWGGFISHPHKTKDIDVLLTKRDGQHATLKELEDLMVDMFNLGYDTHGFYLDTQYMRIPQWIGDYPRNKEILKSVERKQLWINYPTKYEDTGIVCKYRRYGLLNCAYTGSFTLRGIEPSSLVHRWVDLDGDYARMVDLRRIIKYYENNKERNMEDFLNEFQEYSGY